MKKRKTYSIEDAEVFNRLHNEEGMTLRKIAALYETSHSAIKNILIKYGFPYKSRQYMLDETFFEKLDTLEKQYFLGWIYSDGCVFAYEDKNYYGLSIKLQERDKYILEYFKEILGSQSNLHLDRTNGRRYTQFKVGSKKIYDDLLQYGLMPRKTHFIKYPTGIITDHRPFILGVFEGDGSIYINKHKMPRFQITGTKDLVTVIRNILAKELNLFTVPVKRFKNSYRFTFEGTNPVQKIGKWLYSWDPPVFLKRKKELFDQLYTMSKYGKKYVILRCPECGIENEYEKRVLSQVKHYYFKGKFCSLSCSAKFNRKFQINNNKLTLEMETALENNIFSEFKRYKKTNEEGKFIENTGERY